MRVRILTGVCLLAAVTVVWSAFGQSLSSKPLFSEFEGFKFEDFQPTRGGRRSDQSATDVRDVLLRFFPVGSDASEIEAALIELGAKCQGSRYVVPSVLCQYEHSTKGMLLVKTVWKVRIHLRELSEVRGPIADVEVIAQFVGP